MPLPTEIETFQTNIQNIPEIKALMDSVAEDAEFQESMAGTRLSDPLSLVVAVAVWQLLSIGFGVVRRMSENAIVEQRIQIIRQLQEMGYERQAPFIIDRLLKEVRERPEDDPVVKKLTEMYRDE